MTGSADIIAPTLWEQLYPFSWLQTSDKFLVTMHQGTHFSTIGTSDEDPNTYQSLSYEGMGVRQVWDRRVGEWESKNVFLFNAYFTDGVTIEDDGTPSVQGEITFAADNITVIASINDTPIDEADRLFRWESGPRPEDHPGLSELGL